MVKFLKILLFFFLTLFFSCEKESLIVKCSDCTAEEPTEASLKVKLEMSSYGGTTVITVYEGNLEDHVVYKTYHVNSTSTTIQVKINKKYTITASYYVPNSYITTVDSVTPRVKFEKVQCDNPCYYVYDTDIDLRRRTII